MKGDTVRLRFETAKADDPELTVKNKEDGGSEIVFSEGTTTIIRIRFDFFYCFRWIERRELEHAEHTEIDDMDYILINKDTNEELYSKISARLKDSVSAEEQ